jgi:hypothetical protein
MAYLLQCSQKPNSHNYILNLCNQLETFNYTLDKDFISNINQTFID